VAGGTSADASQWYGAVARYSQSTRERGAVIFADRVFRTIRTGATSVTHDGQRIRVEAVPSVRPVTSQVDRLHLKASDNAATECPSTVQCTFVPGSPAGVQVSNRPANGIRIDTIVIHDLETSYDAGVSGLAQPTTSAATHYVMRSSDGAVTQMVPTKDIAFHAGNYSTNLHSIGIEHEGYAVQGAKWYTEAQYQATADLVQYLSARFNIPLDRQHVLGHDNVAGPADSYVSGMHWDPGNGWDWDHFMRLLGHPISGLHEVPPVGSVVTIAPAFDRLHGPAAGVQLRLSAHRAERDGPALRGSGDPRHRRRHESHQRLGQHRPVRPAVRRRRGPGRLDRGLVQRREGVVPQP
jgi:hypothetical protein